MEFKFSSAIFKNDPADNRNNNPNFPTHGGILKMPLSQLEEFVQYLHWAARTELQSDSYMNEKIIPVKISGWTKDSNGKKFLSLSFEPHYKTNMAAQEAKEAQAIAAHSETLQEQQPAQTTTTAAASLAQGTAGTVVTTSTSNVKIPNSPAEFIKGCLDGALEDLGDDTQVTIPPQI